MSQCNCTGKCKTPPYTCSGILASGSLHIASPICSHGALFNDYGCALCDMDKKINGMQEILNSHLACWNTLESKLSGMNENISMLMKFIFGQNPYEKNLANRMQEVEEKVVDIGSDAIYYMTHEEFHKRVVPRIEKLEGYMQMEDRVTATDVLSRLDRLENRYESFAQTQHPKLLKARIDKLEAAYQACMDANPIGAIEKRFTDNEKGLQSHHDGLLKLEEKLNILKLENSNHKSWIEDLEEDFGTVNPVKCPVCEGSGQYRLIQYDGQVDFKDCQACDGKGIVWS